MTLHQEVRWVEVEALRDRIQFFHSTRQQL